MIEIFVFFLGLIFGSFFNVLIYRIPEKQSILFPASHCPKCKKPIKPWQNIPVLSYILLRGKCSNCKVPISIAYPVVELTTGMFSLVLWFLLVKPVVLHAVTWPVVIGLVLYSVFLLLLIPVSVIDLKHYIIPDSFTIPMIIIGVAYSFLPSGITPELSVLGVIGGGGILLLIGHLGKVLFRKDDAMGGGDIKLMAAAGAFFGLKAAFMGIVFGAFLGSVAGITMMLTKRLSSDHHIPFGPYLAAGIWTALFAGEQILHWYISLIQKVIPAY